MEVKVWMDGYQRVVCGVTERTTCHDLMIALAQASGTTGRYAMYEKWRTIEHCLSPAEFPLLILQKWGEYSNDVQFILRHSSPTDGRKKIHPIQALGLEGGPPQRASLKKSLTFSGAHQRAHSSDRSNSRVRFGDCTRNVCHSVESSEQSSIASQSSASLSPFTSLERQNVYKNGSEYGFADLHNDRSTLTESTQTVSRVSTEATAHEKRHPVPNASSRNAISAVPPQPPVPKSRESKPSPLSGKVIKNQIPKLNQNVIKEQESVSISAASYPTSDSAVVSQISNSSASTPSPSSTKTSHSTDRLEQKSDANHNAGNKTNLVTESLSANAQILQSPHQKSAIISASHQNKSKIATANINQTAVQVTEFKEKEAVRPQPNIKRQPPVPTKRFQLPKVGLNLPSKSSSKPSIQHSTSDELNSSKSSESFAKSEDLETSDEDLLREEKEKKALVELINAQEQELRKYESKLKELDCEILLLEGDAEVEEKHLESQLKEIAELESLNKVLDDDLEELELISWEDKIEMERQRGDRLQTEVLLIRSHIEKSEREIQESVVKIEGLTLETDEENKEFDRLIREKQEQEKREIDKLEDDLRHAEMLSQVSERALRSLEQEIGNTDGSLTKRKEELVELENEVKRLNLEMFQSQPLQVVLSRKGRSSLVDRLGLSRPGSSRPLRSDHLAANPHRQNLTLDKARNPFGYVV